MEKKIKVRLSGTDGNVFALGSKVSQALKRAGQLEKAREFQVKLFGCHSYGEALCLMSEYVEIR